MQEASAAPDIGRRNEATRASYHYVAKPMPQMRKIASAGRGHLKRIGAIGLIACTCLFGHLWPQPPLSQLEGLFEESFLKPATMIDASPPGEAENAAATSHPPERSLFGMETEPVLGNLALKWRTVELEINRDAKVLADCRAKKPCPAAARELLNIIAEGASHTGRARVGLINRAVNLAITPASDEAEWGVEDHWSSPFETLQSHRGDCEDYAIVKYIALREAGLPSEDVKLLILRNLFPNEEHAVAAARVDGEWLILDNRWLTLVRDTDTIRTTPQFLLDESGVHRFVSSRGRLLSSLWNATDNAQSRSHRFGNMFLKLCVRRDRTLDAKHKT
jgi:predicted transglutaminase-like cysteine proteinase